MNKLTNVLIKFALGIIKKLVLDKIQYPPVTAIIQSTYTRIEDVANIVTDNDPDNATQLKAYFDTQKLQMAVEAIETAKGIVETEVQNEVVRDLVVELLNQVEQALAA